MHPDGCCPSRQPRRFGSRSRRRSTNAGLALRSAGMAVVSVPVPGMVVGAAVESPRRDRPPSQAAVDATHPRTARRGAPGYCARRGGTAGVRTSGRRRERARLGEVVVVVRVPAESTEARSRSSRSSGRWWTRRCTSTNARTSVLRARGRARVSGRRRGVARRPAACLLHGAPHRSARRRRRCHNRAPPRLGAFQGAAVADDVGMLGPDAYADCPRRYGGGSVGCFGA